MEVAVKITPKRMSRPVTALSKSPGAATAAVESFEKWKLQEYGNNSAVDADTMRAAYNKYLQVKRHGPKIRAR